MFRILISALFAVTLALAPLRVFADDPPAPAAKVVQFHVTIADDEFTFMQPHNSFQLFGKPQKPLDANREVHRNNFGMDLPGSPRVVWMLE
jgi:hypothetical protein